MKMLNDNAKKWVAALRSGEYKQCQQRLTDGEGYCCLGVACAISPNAVDGWKEDCTLPWGVREWLGLATAWGDNNCNGSLSQLNDMGKTFAEIADLIESEPEGLFVKRPA
jgi:hypothetical protein